MRPNSHALISQQFHHIESLRSRPMGGLEYCYKWVPVLHGVAPDDYRFKGRCLAELSRVTGTKTTTIRANWGARFETMPAYAGILLRTTDLLNQVAIGLQLPPGFLK